MRRVLRKFLAFYVEHVVRQIAAFGVTLVRAVRLLGDRGFTGPYTLELEGTSVEGKDLEGRHQAVVECMDYLRSIGVV